MLYDFLLIGVFLFQVERHGIALFLHIGLYHIRIPFLFLIRGFEVSCSFISFGKIVVSLHFHFTDVQLHEALLALAMIIGLVSVLRARTLLITVVSLGVIGYSLAIMFILFGAPDLAMTQFSIETLSVILFVLVLYRLPPLARLSSQRARLRDALLSALAGGMLVVLILTVTSQPLESDLSQFFAQNSYPAAHGRNIVNVILVDFRGFDTMGEITVLSIAAMGIFGLLKLRLDVRQRRAEAERARMEAFELADEEPQEGMEA